MKTWPYAPLLALVLGPATTGCASCSRSSTAERTTDAAPSAVASVAPPGDFASRHPRTHELPPPPADADIPPQPTHEPTWSLDPTDPAHDYVDRYVHSSNRYGAQTTCVVIGKSIFKDGQTSVDVSNDSTGNCGPADATRDSFRVDVAADRMSVVDPAQHDPLRKWPDKSDPEGPPGKPLEYPDMRAWKSPLHAAMADLELTPIRLQWYGRGTYPVVTIAGWHGAVTREASLDALRSVAQKLCAANDERPLGIFGGLDRANLLRIDCPDRPRWERQ